MYSLRARVSRGPGLTAINSRGDVSGTSTTADGSPRPFLWTPESYTLLQLNPPEGFPVAINPCCKTINDRREIVGFMFDADFNSQPFDMAVTGSWSGFFGNMYPVYFRGLAYLAQGRSAEAAAEFQKILDHPGIMFADPAAAVSRLQLARARVKGGDRASAKAAYDDFFKLWKNADADLPILKRAREEYARLL